MHINSKDAIVRYVVNVLIIQFHFFQILEKTLNSNYARGNASWRIGIMIVQRKGRRMNEQSSALRRMALVK